MTALIVITILFAYFYTGGRSYVKIQNRLKPKCTFGSAYCDAACGHSVLAGFSVFAWPLILPIACGIVHEQAPPRAERRRAKELEEAQHRAQLAKLREKEIELLEREAGIKR